MAPQEKIPQRELTVYLLKPSFKEHADAIADAGRLKPFTITSGAATIGRLYVKPPRGKPPRWAAFFADHVDANELGKVASTAAVMLVKTRERLLALVFGAGRFLLLPDCWEERFGLRVALNSIAPDKIRSMDKRTFDALSTHSRIQGSRDGAAPDFGIDIEKDLVRAVTGTPIDADTFGKRLSGMDALHCAVRVLAAEVKPLLRSFLEKDADDSYKKHFPWIDHVAEVTDKSLNARLDARLVENINGPRDRCWLCVPEIIDWGHTAGFRYASGPRDPEYQDLDFNGFLESVDGVVDTELLRRRRAYQIDGEGMRRDDWQIYRCIYCESEFGGHTYLLSSGRWYRVDVEFVRAVNEYFDNLPRYETPLPPYNDACEAAYCARVAASCPDEYALMDQKLVRIGGAHGAVEFCDLFTMGKSLIHIKRYGASSVLSHLFSQGVVSGEAFRAEPSFRAGALEHLEERFRLFSPDHPPEHREYEVVFAVISGKAEALKLPFFSRVNLRQACRRLEAFGYRTAIAKIQVAEERAKLKRYPAR
jgi:uncharacterized protein (TIGR04141 family)